ncbi:MAG: hypothetical protein ACXW2L_21115, partial [Burkholderiales bacterium]
MTAISAAISCLMPSAERLQSIAPAAANPVHMPAHIYFRVGRYHDAAAVNERAIAADHAYLDGTAANRRHMSGYVAHNYHFLTVAAMMAGQSALAL